MDLLEEKCVLVPDSSVEKLSGVISKCGQEIHGSVPTQVADRYLVEWK